MKGKLEFIVMMSYTIMAQDISFWILQFSGLFKRTKDLMLRLIQEDPDTLCLGVSVFTYLPYIPLCPFIFLLAVFRVVLRHKTFWFIQLDHEKAGKIVLTGIISFTGFFLLLIWFTTGNICDFQTIQVTALVAMGIDIKIPSSIQIIWNPIYFIDFSVWASILIHLACSLEENLNNIRKYINKKINSVGKHSIISSKENIVGIQTVHDSPRHEENPPVQFEINEDCSCSSTVHIPQTVMYAKKGSRTQKTLDREVKEDNANLSNIQVYTIPGVVEETTALKQNIRSIPENENDEALPTSEPIVRVQPYKHVRKVKNITALPSTQRILTIVEEVKETNDATTNQQIINIVNANENFDTNIETQHTSDMVKLSNSSSKTSQTVGRTRKVDLMKVPVQKESTQSKSTSQIFLQGESDLVPLENKKTKVIMLKGLFLSLLIVSIQIGSYMAFDEKYSYWSFLIVSNFFRLIFRIALLCILILHQSYYNFFARKTKALLYYVSGRDVHE